MKSSLYDSYIKAFRWASDRIKDKGVVAFVTNFGELVGLIESARERVWRTVNAELVGLYWEIGKWLSAKCAKAEWGDRIIADGETADGLSRRADGGR